MGVTTAKFKPGDRVVRTCWPAGQPGAVVKVSKTTALVRFDGESEAKRIGLDALRPETAADVAKRNHERAMAAWRDARPRTTVADVQHDPAWGSPRGKIGAVVHRAETPEQMRQAARELLELATWFESRPKENA